MKPVCIIPARGGSKRIPKKNVKLLNGKPLIAYSIESALNSNVFDDVIVSTDNDEIADVAREYGASIPFMRTPQTSDDHAGLADVAIEVLSDLNQIGRNYQSACFLLATAPFVTSEILKQSDKLFSENKDADALIPIVRYSYPIQRSFRINDKNFLEMRWPENYLIRTQDFEPTFHDSGLYYFIDSGALMREKRFFLEKTVGIEISETVTQDIDTEEDWEIAEFKLAYIQEKM
jgi:pseudaminic acid cytidylyltransferase